MDIEIREIVSELEGIRSLSSETLNQGYMTKALIRAMGVIADKLERIALTLEEQNK